MNLDILDAKYGRDIETFARQVSHLSVKVKALQDEQDKLNEKYHRMDKAIVLISNNVGAVIKQQEDYQIRLNQQWEDFEKQIESYRAKVTEELAPLLHDKHRRDAARDFFKGTMNKFILMPLLFFLGLAIIGVHDLMENIDFRKTVVHYLTK